MQLHLDKLGMIPQSWPRPFWRVECWNVGRRIADFTTQTEAAKFAIDHAMQNGYRYDHKVCKMTMATA